MRSINEHGAGAKKATHLATLTSIRFFAAAWVVAFHLQIGHLIPELPLLGPILERGHLGVPLFFILSGFILAFTYADRLRGGSYSHKSFLIARFARIYPVYLGALALGAVQKVFFHPSGSVAALQTDTLKTIALHLFLLQNWDRNIVGGINEPAWSIAVEAAFYLLFPIFAVIVFRIPERKLLLSAAIVAFVGFWIEIVVTNGALRLFSRGYSAAEVQHLTVLASAWIPLPRFDEFILGILAFRFATAPSLTGWWRGAFVYTGALVLLLLVTQRALSLRHLPGSELLVYVPNPQLILAPIPFLALIVGLARTRGEFPRWLAHPALVYGGKISFSIYLVHMPIINIGLTIPDHGSSALRSLITVLSVVMTLGGAALLFQLVEEPGRRWILGLTKGERRPPAPLRNST